MPGDHATDEVSVEFIRMFFRSAVEEQIAHGWATRLAGLLGPRVMDLRPTTTLFEILQWAIETGADHFDFVFVFEPELNLEFAAFLDNSDFATFRDMVEAAARRFE